MALRRRNSAILRRLAAITVATRRRVGHRRSLRERARGARVIHLAARRAAIDPAQIRGLARIAWTPRGLAELGLTPENERSDADFIRHDPVLAAQRDWPQRVAHLVPRFVRMPPHGRDASLDDWYAWALARQRPAAGFGAPRRAARASAGSGNRWKKRAPLALLDGALQRLRGRVSATGFMAFARASPRR